MASSGIIAVENFSQSAVVTLLVRLNRGESIGFSYEAGGPLAFSVSKMGGSFVVHDDRGRALASASTFAEVWQKRPRSARPSASAHRVLRAQESGSPRKMRPFLPLQVAVALDHLRRHPPQLRPDLDGGNDAPMDVAPGSTDAILGEDATDAQGHTEPANPAAGAAIESEPGAMEQWLLQRCRIEVGNDERTATTQDLFASYQGFMQDRQKPCLPMRNFALSLQERGLRKSKNVTSAAGARVRGFLGISLEK